MTRKIIALMYQSWTDLNHAISGLPSETAIARHDGGSSIAWTAGHVTNQVDAWLNVRFQGLPPHPLIGQPSFRAGGTGATEDWPDILAELREVQMAARTFLDNVPDADLDRAIPYDGSIAYLRSTGLSLRHAVGRHRRTPFPARRRDPNRPRPAGSRRRGHSRLGCVVRLTSERGAEEASVAIEAVIFDLDDTLCRRTAPIDWDAITAGQVAAMTPHCARLGFDHLDLTEVVRHFWTTFETLYPEPDRHPDAPIEERRWRDGPTALRDTLAGYGVECADDDVVCLWEALWTVPPHVWNRHLYPDAVPTVLALNAAGYRLAVATARPQSVAVVARELREMGLPDLLAAVATSGEEGYRKPHPLVFESAAKQLGVRPEQAVVVGDSYEWDIIPAASLGMIPVLKLNDRSPDPSWALAHHQVPSLAALLELEVLRERARA